MASSLPIKDSASIKKRTLEPLLPPRVGDSESSYDAYLNNYAKYVAYVEERRDRAQAARQERELDRPKPKRTPAQPKVVSDETKRQRKLAKNRRKRKARREKKTAAKVAELQTQVKLTKLGKQLEKLKEKKPQKEKTVTAALSAVRQSDKKDSKPEKDKQPESAPTAPPKELPTSPVNTGRKRRGSSAARPGPVERNITVQTQTSVASSSLLPDPLPMPVRAPPIDIHPGIPKDTYRAVESLQKAAGHVEVNATLDGDYATGFPETFPYPLVMYYQEETGKPLYIAKHGLRNLEKTITGNIKFEGKTYYKSKSKALSKSKY